MNILEGNKLIMEFLTDEPEVLEVDLKKAGTLESLEFHKSWDWLIPAIEQCRKIDVIGSKRLIKNIDKKLLKLDLYGTFKNVIEFIQWYNKFIEWYNQNKPE